ncbi:hypothetical protein ACQP1K_07650 [Sphaerimonospora sp. CA-214678]|uniref:hypothetical protein n=1 Tax=Sphaerimonospora sp. CA-214678 TaxID=3240029 RepID=UPI003D90D241
MSEQKLSSSQTAVLLVLMAEAREISNLELGELYDVTLSGVDRKKLNDLKLVESWKQGRAFVHVLTDSGWAYTAELFREGMQASGRPAGRVLEAALRAIVANLPRHMGRTESSLADLFAREEDVVPAAVETAAPEAYAPETPALESVAPVPSGAAAAPATDAPTLSAQDIETRIRKAYAQLAGGPNAWVSLTLLRPLLGDAPRHEVDTALRRMIGMPDVRIVPWENQKTLTQTDRDAAVVIGDQAKHMILIGA